MVPVPRLGEEGYAGLLRRAAKAGTITVVERRERVRLNRAVAWTGEEE